MPVLTQSDVHVNGPLTNMSVGWQQSASGFVAGRVFPTIGVPKASDLYYIFNRGDAYRDQMAPRAISAPAARSGFRITTDNYSAQVYALAQPIDDRVRANADTVLQLDASTTQFLTTQAMIRAEKLWATKYFAGGLWTGDDDGVASSPGANQFLQWNDASSTPIEDVDAARASILETTGFKPNKMVVGYRVWNALKNHPDIVARVSGGATTAMPALVMREKLAQLFEVDELLVMEGVENTADRGQTDVGAFIGGKKALLCYAAPSPQVNMPSAGYTFAWTGFVGAGATGTRIKKFRNDDIASDIIEIEMAIDQKLVSADLGYFFDSAVA